MSAARIAASRRSTRGAGAVLSAGVDLGREQVAALRHGLEQLLRLVAQRLPDVADALGDRFVVDDHVRPDRGHDRVAVHDAAGVLDQQPQQRQRLRPQRHLGPVRPEQGAAGEVEREAVEAPGGGRRAFGAHRIYPCLAVALPVPPDAAFARCLSQSGRRFFGSSFAATSGLAQRGSPAFLALLTTIAAEEPPG